MSGWRDRVRAALRAQSAYHVPAVDAEVKLDANESPYPPPAELVAAVAAAMADVPLHRYPDPRASKLRALVAADLGQPADRLLFGNGADEVIAALCSTFAEPAPGPRGVRGAIVSPSPSFVVFRQAALAAGLEAVDAPLGPRFEPRLDTLLEAMETSRPSIVFLATPNNPTGTVWPRALVEEAVRAATDSVFVIDHAYLAYGGEDLSDLIERHEHVAVLRTYSKVGLAGLRLGVLVARPELVAEVEKVRLPYNLSLVAQRAAAAALGPCRALVGQHVAAIVAERARLAAALAALGAARGEGRLEVFPSGANLLMVRVPDARAVWEGLLARSILVRLFDTSRGPMAGCLRITVGTPAENDRLLAALAELV